MRLGDLGIVVNFLGGGGRGFFFYMVMYSIASVYRHISLALFAIRSADNIFCQLEKYRPCVAQWLGEAGVRSSTAAQQRRKKWEVCASQLGAWH